MIFFHANQSASINKKCILSDCFLGMVSDSEKAAEYIELLQQRLWSRNDHSQDDDLTSIICMLESPMFKQLLTIQVGENLFVHLLHVYY